MRNFFLSLGFLAASLMVCGCSEVQFSTFVILPDEVVTIDTNPQVIKTEAADLKLLLQASKDGMLADFSSRVTASYRGYDGSISSVSLEPVVGDSVAVSDKQKVFPFAFGTDFESVALSVSLKVGRSEDSKNIVVVRSRLPDDDTDGDDLPNYWELMHNLDPESSVGNDGASGDPDSDGLTNIMEFALGTDPWNADSDGDGLPDGWENRYGLDPLSGDDAFIDSDGDGVANLIEYQHGCNPLNADTDGDGFTDGEELRSCSSPTDPFCQPMIDDGSGVKQDVNVVYNGRPGGTINLQADFFSKKPSQLFNALDEATKFSDLKYLLVDYSFPGGLTIDGQQIFRLMEVVPLALTDSQPRLNIDLKGECYDLDGNAVDLSFSPDLLVDIRLYAMLGDEQIHQFKTYVFSLYLNEINSAPLVNGFYRCNWGGLEYLLDIEMKVNGQVLASINVKPGDPMIFTAEVWGGIGPFCYQWYRDGVPIPDAVYLDFPIEKMTEADQGVYSCIVIDQEGKMIDSCE
jgi:hypothetical protein